MGLGIWMAEDSKQISISLVLATGLYVHTVQSSVQYNEAAMKCAYVYRV